jgi:hypothetical protein
MSEPEASSSKDQGLLVPGFVRNLEAIGKRRSFVTSIGIEPIYERRIYEKVNHLVGRWRGTRRQFLGLKFAVPSFRVPLTGGEVLMHTNSTLRGGYSYIEVDGKNVLFLPDFGRVPVRIEDRGDIEVVEYEERIAYHGSIQALIAAGIPKQRLTLPRLRTWRDGSSNETFGECRWNMQRQPDGLIVYTVDTEEAQIARKTRAAERERQQREYDQVHTQMEARRAREMAGLPEPIEPKPPRPSYLRLVIDNTKENAHG